MGVKKPSWSYSSVKQYETCPKQYYHLRVARDYKDEPNEANMYGDRLHKAAELHIGKGEPLPPEFEFLQSSLDRIKAIPGEIHVEYRMALDYDLKPCDSRVAWWRGIADVLIIDGKLAHVIDYKAGKSATYADRKQLEMMAMAVFEHFPEVEVVRGALFFVIAKALIKGKYLRSDKHKMWEDWLKRYRQILISTKTNVWNPKPSGLCHRYCPVLSCPHNGRS